MRVTASGAVTQTAPAPHVIADPVLPQQPSCGPAPLRPIATLVRMDPAILLYDADCGFCRLAAAKILAWDQRDRLRAVPLQDEEAKALVPQETRMASWHLILRGAHYSGGQAVAPLARLLRGGAPIAALAEMAPSLTDSAYRWVADHRELLGRALGQRACAVDPATSRPRRSRA
jgi:predicted DCC family thiol-disulfide oxidoreductase YuxK